MSFLLSILISMASVAVNVLQALDVSIFKSWWIYEPKAPKALSE